MPKMDPNLRYDQLKKPFRGHALVDIVNERYENRYDFSGGMGFQTPDEMEETTVFYDTHAPEEDKEIDRWTGFPKNQFKFSEMAARHEDWPTWDEIDAVYQEYLSEYDAYEGKRQRKYPDWRDQLDTLYHDIENGLLGDSAKESEFYKIINKIKTENQ